MDMQRGTRATYTAGIASLERIGGGRLEVPDPQDRIRAPDERLAAIYDHVGAGIVEVDKDGRMLRVNQQLCRLTGHSASELLGRTIFQETLPEDVPEDRNQFRRQLAGEIDRYTIEKRIYCKDGGHIWASVTSSSVRDAAGNFLYAVRVQHDITDRKRAEEALTRRKEEQAALFEFSERLQHCTSVEQVYDAALDAITRALSCKARVDPAVRPGGRDAVRGMARPDRCLPAGGRRPFTVASQRN
jgi:PAS domain S-box-containing protein